MFSRPLGRYPTVKKARRKFRPGSKQNLCRERFSGPHRSRKPLLHRKMRQAEEFASRAEHAALSKWPRVDPLSLRGRGENRELSRAIGSDRPLLQLPIDQAIKDVALTRLIAQLRNRRADLIER